MKEGPRPEGYKQLGGGVPLSPPLFGQEDINAIKEAIKRMGSIHQDAFLATTGPKEAKLSQELNAVIQETNPKAARAKALLNVSHTTPYYVIILPVGAQSIDAI